MNSQIEEVLLGILTSILTGLAVWFWAKFKFDRTNRLKSKFFGIKKNSPVYFTINQYPNSPELMSHGDILTLLDVSKIAQELEGEISIEPVNDVKVVPGDQVEFCIGGVDSNPRSRIFLDKYFKGISMNSYKDIDSLLIFTNNKSFSYIKGKQAYSILARFYPDDKPNPVFLICGQTSLSNRATAYYLSKNYAKLLKEYRDKPFCQIIGIEDFQLFGYKSAKLIEDISDKLNDN